MTTTVTKNPVSTNTSTELQSKLCQEFAELKECYPISIKFLWCDKDTHKSRYRVNGWKTKDGKTSITFSRFVIAWRSKVGMVYKVLPSMGRAIPSLT